MRGMRLQMAARRRPPKETAQFRRERAPGKEKKNSGPIRRPATGGAKTSSPSKFHASGRTAGAHRGRACPRRRRCEATTGPSTRPMSVPRGWRPVEWRSSLVSARLANTYARAATRRGPPKKRPGSGELGRSWDVQTMFDQTPAMGGGQDQAPSKLRAKVAFMRPTSPPRRRATAEPRPRPALPPEPLGSPGHGRWISPCSTLPGAALGMQPTGGVAVGMRTLVATGLQGVEGVRRQRVGAVEQQRTHVG